MGFSDVRVMLMLRQYYPQKSNVDHITLVDKVLNQTISSKLQSLFGVTLKDRLISVDSAPGM